MVHKKLAVQLIGFIVDAEEKDFDRRLPVIIPLLLTCLEKKKGPVEEKEGEEIEEMDDEEDDLEGDNDEVTLVDHLLFNTLLTIEKIFTICSIAGKSRRLLSLYDQLWGALLAVKHFVMYEAADAVSKLQLAILIDVCHKLHVYTYTYRCLEHSGQLLQYYNNVQQLLVTHTVVYVITD